MSNTPILPLAPSDETSCERIVVDATGHVVQDPVELLGLDSINASAESVREAWLREIKAHPPEREPELALALREARDRLTEPARLLEKHLGVLYVPKAERHDLPTEVPALGNDDSSGGMLSSEARIYGQLALYALLEDTIVKAQR